MNRIKKVLNDKGISQTWLAKQTGKSYNTINEYARNVRQPSIEFLYEIAEILKRSNLISSIPGYSTHVEGNMLSPTINWNQI